MAWNAPMSQFSWRKACVYGLVCLASSAVLQALVVLPGTQRWIGEEQRRRDRPRVLEEYQSENARMMGTIVELQRQLAEREEAIKKREERIRSLEAVRVGRPDGKGKGK